MIDNISYDIILNESDCMHCVKATKRQNPEFYLIEPKSYLITRIPGIPQPDPYRSEVIYWKILHNLHLLFL
jgi:hypothetical protein